MSYTIPLAERLGRRVVLAPSGGLNSNRVLFDGSAGQPLYVVPTSPSRVSHDAVGGSKTDYELADPKGVAREMLRLI